MNENLRAGGHTVTDLLKPDELGEFDSSETEKVHLAATLLGVGMSDAVDSGDCMEDGEFDFRMVATDRRIEAENIVRFSGFAAALEILAPRADGQSWMEHAFCLAQDDEVRERIDEYFASVDSPPAYES